MFDPARIEARAVARARAQRALRERVCRPALLNRRAWPRRYRPFVCRPPGGRSFARGFPRRQYVPNRPLNACNLGWPGGYINVPPGGEVPKGFARTGFANGLPTNPRCFPGTGSGDVATGTGGTLGGSIAVARQEAERLRAVTALQTLRDAPRLNGVTIDEQNAFALRYGDDVCDPWTCDFGGPGRAPGEFAGTSHGREQIARAIAFGFRSVPLAHAALELKLGRKATPGDRAAACNQPEFLIQGRVPRRRGGAWPGSRRAPSGGPSLVQLAGGRRVLLPGAAPLPDPISGVPTPAPGAPPAPVTVFACRIIPGTTVKAFYEGPYIPGMEAYWSAGGGRVFSTRAERDSFCAGL